MKRYVFLIIIVVIIVLLFRAWRKETIEVNISMPVFTERTKNELPQKAPKSRHPNSREEKCRDIFETLTGKAYPTVRPDFLKNPATGRNLELDGYCAELKSAFEYQGSQHYKYPNRFHKTKEEFLSQVERDRFKVQRCQEEGINLIVVPYNMTDEEMLDFISVSIKR